MFDITAHCANGIANLESLLQQADGLEEQFRQGQLGSTTDKAAHVDVQRTGAALATLGEHFLRTGRLRESLVTFRRLLKLAERVADSGLWSVACNNLAVVYREMGDASHAVALQHRSWDAELHDAMIENRECDAGCDLGNHANDAILAGDLPGAERLLRLSLRWETAHGSTAGAAADWGNLGVVALLRGHHRRAVHSLRQALRLHRQLGDDRGIGCDLLHLGLLCDSIDRRRAAVRLLTRAKHYLQESGATHLAKKASAVLAEVQRQILIETFDQQRN